MAQYTSVKLCILEEVRAILVCKIKKIEHVYDNLEDVTQRTELHRR
jgi:hypothetical protein